MFKLSEKNQKTIRFLFVEITLKMIEDMQDLEVLNVF